MEPKSVMLDIRTMYGGKFVWGQGKQEYVSISGVIDDPNFGLDLQCGVCSSAVNYKSLRRNAEKLVGHEDFELWYKKKIKNLRFGRCLISSESGIGHLLASVDERNSITLYVIQPVRKTVTAPPKLAQTAEELAASEIDIVSGLVQTNSQPTSTSSPTKSPVEKKPNIRAHQKSSSNSGPLDDDLHRKIPYTSIFPKTCDPHHTFNAQPVLSITPLQVIRPPTNSNPKQCKDSTFQSHTKNQTPFESNCQPPENSFGVCESNTKTVDPEPPLSPSFNLSQGPFRSKLPVRRKLQRADVEGKSSVTSLTNQEGADAGDEANQSATVIEGVTELCNPEKKSATSTGVPNQQNQSATKPKVSKTKQVVESAVGQGKSDSAQVGVGQSQRESGLGKRKSDSAGGGRKSGSAVGKVGKQKSSVQEKRAVQSKRKGKTVPQEPKKKGVVEVGKKKGGADSSKQKGKAKVVRNLRTRKQVTSEGDLSDDDFVDSEDSDEEALSDPDWGVDDFDEDIYEDDDLGGLGSGVDVLQQVEKSLGVGRTVGEGSRGTVRDVDDLNVTVNEDEQDDSDELRSLRGSDDEVDVDSTFNPEVDFRGKIVLKKGLKFSSNVVLRKALVHHSVQEGYDFYYTHNNNSRVTVRCRNRCDCEWNKKRSGLGACNCEEGIRCDFKVHATKLKGELTFQIKSMRSEHGCSHARYNSKVTSEYLADRYIDFWRNNIDWKIKSFRAQVLTELNVDVGYYRCWRARCRAKLEIYGNGKDQYARVWDYAAAIKKYNKGSSAFVVCDNIDRPPPLFKRMYVCLQACKEGFKRGCRPIMGLDGCHLKGLYPGMILVAVAKDGNNKIFPVAWAVVEVENTQSWVWFLEQLSNDLGKDEGKGLTFMSDRQKGLIDALKVVVPKASTRYCARHIWANFKLTFSGQVYKDSFWKAARASTKAEFDSQMEGIKFLSTEAWSYLNKIPAKHWSRHAFDDHCKSNMLLNNICETFNSVLKDARDKPILTLMEWMRRYVMKRHCEMREAVNKYKGRFMPYAVSYVKHATDRSKDCRYTPSSADVFEVDSHSDTWVVNLKERTCFCYQWNLTGLPCEHAVGCILMMRLKPEVFIDDYYSKATYVKAYEPTIYPLPGAKHWEKTDLPEPLPPPMRKMPGRPSLKKRKKEAGEGDQTNVKRQKRVNQCSNCGGLGHYKRTCKKDPAPKQPRENGGRPLSSTPWAKETRVKTQKRRADKEASTSANPPPTTDALSQASCANPPANEPPSTSTNAPATSSTMP